MISRLFRNYNFGFAVFLSVILCLLLAFLFKSRSYDDPYITYRYADNIRRGVGFVYNRGEHVQSTTTPLFTLLLAGFSSVWGDLPHLANLIGAISLAASGLLLWKLAVTWDAPWAGFAGLVLYPLFPLGITTIGSETPLYIAFCLGAFVAYTRRRTTLAAVCAALAALTRPDGLLVGVILAIDFTFRLIHPQDEARTAPYNRRVASIPWKAIGLFLIILLPWFLFAWIYFGSPLPATLAAKQQQGAMAVSQRFAGGFLTVLGWYKTWRYELEAALAVLGLVFVIGRARKWLLFLAWPVLYFVAFSILGVSRYFWYYAPLVPGFILLGGVGIQAIARISINHVLPRGRLVSVFQKLYDRLQINFGRSLSLAIFLLLVIAQARDLTHLQSPDPRVAIYRAAGEWLAAYTPTNAVVGALEVGILGYYARRPMVDFAGLIQPEVAAKLTGGSNYEYAAIWTVEFFHPRYLVLFPGDFPQLEAGYVAQFCRLDKSFSGQTFGFSKDLSIYECQ